MTDEQALIAVILADPANDLPRLVYADWLEEQGRLERAEFIRVQCEMAKLPEAHLCFSCTMKKSPPCHCQGGAKTDPARALLLRQNELFNDRCLTGGFPGAKMTVPHPFDPEQDYPFTHPVEYWHRGFIDGTVCPSAAFLAHGDAITAAHPVSRVRLTDVPNWERSPHPNLRLIGDRVSFTPREVSREMTESEWETDSRTGRQPGAFIAPLLRLRWPGITFELPAEPNHPRDAMGRFIAATTAFVETVGQTAERFGELARIMNGDPDAPTPAGVIEAPDPAECAAPLPRRPRRPDFSDRGWQPRFPRPR